ncbi:hypothetical protein BC629DRAFT_890205 [Irpex lacteus]|nr:hypothetical protein BC629DRAFT_890205 [Irpex lacteus]
MHSVSQETASDMGTSVNNLNGWAPVSEDTDVCIQSALTRKYIDYAWTHGTGSRKLHQWDGGNPPSPNKTWKLEPTELAGYLIRHAETGLCLIPTTIGAEGRVYLDNLPRGHGVRDHRGECVLREWREACVVASREWRRLQVVFEAFEWDTAGADEMRKHIADFELHYSTNRATCSVFYTHLRRAICQWVYAQAVPIHVNLVDSPTSIAAK